MKMLALVLLLAVVGAPAALLLGGRTTRPASAPQPWRAPLAERASAAFPRRYVGPGGEIVTVPAPPQRIVSATVFSDAVLLAVCPERRIGALHQLSTDPRYSPVAAASAAFPRHMAGAPEEILALAPDLVVVSSFSRKEVRNLLGQQGCAVVRFAGFDSVADIETNIRALGWVLGLDRGCEALVTDMQSELDRIAENAAQRRPWRVLHYAYDYTSGTETTFDSLLRYVGARNVGAEMGLVGSAAIRPEEVLLQDPDALVVGVDHASDDVERRLAQLPGFTALQAMRRHHVITVPNALLLSTSQHVVEAAQRIAAQLDEWGAPPRRPAGAEPRSPR